LSDDDVREKFVANASLALKSKDVRALEAAVLGLEQIADLRIALSPLGRAVPTTS